MIADLGSGFGSLSDRFAHLFSKTESFDKMAKLGGYILEVALIYNKGTDMPKISALRGDLRCLTNFINGCNLPQRVKEFSELNEEGNIKYFDGKTRYKLFSRIALTVGNTCSTVTLLSSWGVDFSRAADLIGKVPVFKVISDYGLSSINSVSIITSSVFSIVDYALELNKLHTEAKTTSHVEKKRSMVYAGIVAEVCKIFMVVIGWQFKSFMSTYQFLAVAILGQTLQLYKIDLDYTIKSQK